ncbi:UDP-glucose 4-epimerase GalE [Bacteroidales bacterium OttesenSCG-928-I21]|nr:UDP-glucose 4-epimerase GalE [Bacteroidales bacterium OttesenSCG-928-I21]
MKKIIITGGAGYIGSHTVVEFQEAGFEVVIIDNLSNSNIKVIDGIKKITGIRPLFYKSNIANYSEIDTIFSEHKDAVALVHFAAYKAVGESVQKPLMYYSNNLTGLINILSLMIDNNIPNFVFSSSCTVYGQPKQLPVTEESPVVKAESPYGNTKKISEEIIVDTLSANPQLKTISLRYFNPIGAHPSAEIGELPIGVPNNLLPYITQTAIGIREKLSVFGNDYNTPDGTAIRDYVNVVDLAKSHVAAVNRLLEVKNTEACEVFNIGTGKGVSVLEIIESFERSTGQKLPYKIVDRRAGDVEQVWANTTKANNILKWKAEKTLDETIKSAWEWEKKLRGI